MADFLLSTFTGSNGSITTDTPTTGGAWSVLSGTAPQVVSTQLVPQAAAFSVSSNAGTPGSADYQVVVTFIATVNSGGTSGAIAAMFRVADNTHWYSGRYNAAGQYLEIISATGGGTVLGAQVAQTVVAGNSYDIGIKGSGSSLTLMFGPTGSAVDMFSRTDSTFTAAGKAGIQAYAATPSGNTYKITKIQAGPITAATAYTLSGPTPTSGAVGAASSNLTVTSNGVLGSSVTVTPAVSGITGTFSPTSATLAAGTNTSATFTFTPTSAGVATISTTNNGSLTDPASVTYTGVAAATAFTLTNASPSSGAVSTASNNFTVASNGYLSSAVTITPAVSGITGTFSPTSVTLAIGSSTSNTFTFTPTAVGTATISATDSDSLTDPASVTYTSTSGPSTIGVSSAARFQSPGNWSGDTGRSGSSYRQTATPGAWATYVWIGGASSPTATLLATNATAGSTISYMLNGKLTVNVSVPTSGGISISGVATGTNTLTYWLRASAYTVRWNLTNSLKDSGLTIDAGSSAGTAPTLGNWVLDIGDSLKEGVQAKDGSDDYLSCYSYGVARGLDNLGYSLGVQAYGYSGWIRPGGTAGDVPGYYKVASAAYDATNSRWNKIDSTNSLLDSNGHISAYGATGTEPSMIFINYGTNEALQSTSTSDLQLSIVGCLGALRTAAPNAWLVVAVPFGLYDTTIHTNGLTYVTAIKAGVATYQAANPSDAKMVLLDLGSNVGKALGSTIYGASVHPNIAGNAYLAPQVMQFLTSKLSATTSAGLKRASFGGGF